jgi:hypothetical protein
VKWFPLHLACVSRFEDFSMAADHSHHTQTAHSAMDYAEHEKTFSLFAALIKWGTVASVGLLVFAGAATGLIPWLLAIAIIAASVFGAVKLF